MGSYRIISSDNHVIEPPDLWVGRGPSKFKDRMPHAVSMEEGDLWFCEGQQIASTAAGATAGLRFEDPGQMGTTVKRTEHNRPGSNDPAEHVKDLDIDGVDASIIYPTTGSVLYNVQDTDLLTAICQTYNDWLAEFFSYNPNRLKGVAMLNVDDVGLGVKELERCHKMGFTGAMIPVYPPESHLYDQPEYDPLWAAAQELGMPIGLHISSNRASSEFADPANYRPTFICNADYWPRMSLADLIFGGVFERFPGLRIGSVEHELSWVPHFLDRIDYTYAQRSGERVKEGWFKGDVLPSDFFHSNVFLGFQEDGPGVRDRHIIGVDNLQWGSDYPHSEGTFPRSRQIVEEVLADCTEEEKAKIAGGNAARVYHLN